MKFTSAVLLLASAASVAGHAIRKPLNKAKLLSLARRLEDQNGDDAADEQQYQFLGDYSLKMIGCSAEKYQNPEDGEYEYSSVVVRLCPADACDNEGVGCTEGYGDYVVGINTFVEAWLRDKEEDMQDDGGNGDDQWDMNEFAECREYDVDQDADDEDADENAGWYVGPTCIDGVDIGLGFFSDYTCTTVPDGVSFEDISNGWTLPYEDGGLVTSYCESCAGYNDNGEYELGEMCMSIYEGASSRCEGKMETYSAYGTDDSGCEYIAEAFPSTVAKSSSVGMIILWILIALIVCGGLFFVYTKWWMKRKQGSAANLSSSDGVAA